MRAWAGIVLTLAACGHEGPCEALEPGTYTATIEPISGDCDPAAVLVDGFPVGELAPGCSGQVVDDLEMCTQFSNIVCLEFDGDVFQGARRHVADLAITSPTEAHGTLTVTLSSYGPPPCTSRFNVAYIKQ